MSRPLVVRRAVPHLWWSKVTVYAERDARAVFGSLLGDRIFHLDKGHRLTLRVTGRDWRAGDRLEMGHLVEAARSWADIPWYWR